LRLTPQDKAFAAVARPQEVTVEVTVKMRAVYALYICVSNHFVFEIDAGHA
jgi:hypothetical protein